jgi:O-antigen ligase
MSVLARGGWAISAAFFLLVTSSILHADYVGAVPGTLIVLAVALCVWRPVSGLEILTAVIPVSDYLLSGRWNSAVSWAEVFACAAIAGLSIDAARRPRETRVPLAIGAPALLFGLVVTAAVVASLAGKSLVLGPAFASDLTRHLSHLYFVESAAYPGLHAGMLLLEGILLFAFAARLARAGSGVLTRIAAAATIGATLAGVINVSHLLDAALRGSPLAAELLRLSRTVRWNVEYADFNAAGSYFVMLLCVAGGLIQTPGLRRRGWTLCGIIIATALWLTGSRAAYVAGVLALAAAAAVQWVKPSGRRRFAVAAGLMTAVLAIVAFIALAAPQRGNQHSSRIAADIRLQMAMAGGRMIAAHPMFGIGLGEFHQRSGDFISAELLTLFPVSTHENAHNNFVQVAAELGVPGALTFTWLVGAGLFLAARYAARTRAPLPLLTFAGLAAFVVTWLAGHPLLIPEPAYIFWVLLGAAAGATADATDARGGWRRSLVVLASIAIVALAPFHAREVMDDAELEHVGFGLSPKWLLSPDGIRYRAAEGHGVVFVPSHSAFTFSINPRADRPVRLELRLENRVADVIALAPDRWNDVTLPVRADRKAPRFIPMDLRILDGNQIEIWLTKVRPLDAR